MIIKRRVATSRIFFLKIGNFRWKLSVYKRRFFFRKGQRISILRINMTVVKNGICKTYCRSRSCAQNVFGVCKFANCRLKADENNSSFQNYSNRCIFWFTVSLNWIEASISFRARGKIINPDPYVLYQIKDLEGELDSEQRRHTETQKNTRKMDRRMKELAFQCDEDRKNQERLQEMIDKLQEKVNVYKRQLEEAVSNKKWAGRGGTGDDRQTAGEGQRLQATARGSGK